MLRVFLVLACILLELAAAADNTKLPEYPSAIINQGSWYGSKEQQFGASIGVIRAPANGPNPNEDEIVVGSKNADDGSITIYKRNNNGDFPTSDKFIYKFGQGNVTDDKTGGYAFELTWNVYDADNKNIGQNFGESVAVVTGNVIVGAPKGNRAYLLTKMKNGDWPNRLLDNSLNEAQKTNLPRVMTQYKQNADDVIAPASETLAIMGADDRYGCDVGINTNYLFITACAYNANQGAVYIYTKVGSTDGTYSVTPRQVITGSQTGAAAGDGISLTSENSRFGQSISVTETYIAVGAPTGLNNNNPAVYIFGLDANKLWQELQIIKGDRPNGRFGAALSMSPKHIVIGNAQESSCSRAVAIEKESGCDRIATDFKGEVQSFRYTGDGTSIKIAAPQKFSGTREKGQFGLSVHVSEKNMVVGTNYYTALIYALASEGGDAEWTIEPAAKQTGDGSGYGHDVYANEKYVIVTAPQQYGKDSQAKEAGHTLIYRIFDVSSLSVTFYFVLSVFSLTLFCFLLIFIKFACLEKGDDKVVDSKLAAKAARLGFDHHNVANKKIRRKGEKARKGPKKHLKAQSSMKAMPAESAATTATESSAIDAMAQL